MIYRLLARVTLEIVMKAIIDFIIIWCCMVSIYKSMLSIRYLFLIIIIFMWIVLHVLLLEFF